MAEARYFCPDCGSIDLIVANAELRDHEGKTLGRAECPNCSWKGRLVDTVGALTTEQFWDSDRVGEVLLRVLATRGAGPLVQALEFIGLLPRKREKPYLTKDATPEEMAKYESDLALYNDPSTYKWNKAAQEARDHVMRRFMEASLTALFEEAEKQNRLFAIATETDIHPMLKEEANVETFGGDFAEKKITNIKEARRKKEKGR